MVVEGQTEETFVRDVLAPELWPRDIVTDVHRITTGRRHSRISRGGLTKYRHLEHDLRLWMRQDQNADAVFTSMIDLYALPVEFPGTLECHRFADPLRRVECLEANLMAEMNIRGLSLTFNFTSLKRFSSRNQDNSWWSFRMATTRCDNWRRFAMSSKPLSTSTPATKPPHPNEYAHCCPVILRRLPGHSLRAKSVSEKCAKNAPTLTVGSNNSSVMAVKRMIKQ